VLLMVSFGGVLLWCLKMSMPGQLQAQHMNYMTKCKALTDRLRDAVKQGDFMDQCERVILDATDYDRSGLSEFLNTLDKAKLIGGAGGLGTTAQFARAEVKGDNAPQGSPETVSA